MTSLTLRASLVRGGFHARQGVTATAMALASIPLAASFSAILCHISSSSVRAFRLAAGSSARASGVFEGTVSCPAAMMAGKHLSQPTVWHYFQNALLPWALVPFLLHGKGSFRIEATDSQHLLLPLLCLLYL